MQANFAVLVALGPEGAEAARLVDLLEALVRYEPGCNLVVLVNDGQPDSVLREIAAGVPLHAVLLDNPRCGRGFGYTGGLAVGILKGLSWIAAHTDAQFVLKADTDSLIIGPFGRKIVRFFNSNPSCGLIGTHRKYPDGTDNESGLDWAPLIEKVYRPLSFWGKNLYVRRHIRISFWGRARRIRRIIRSALLHGYAFGDHCQGGGYAVSRVALDTFEHDGLFRDPLLFLDSALSEDIILGLLVKSVGLKLENFNATGEVFGVTFRGLCASPPELVARGYSIIHSVKDFHDIKEKEVREFFRARRQTAKTLPPASIFPGAATPGREPRCPILSKT